MGGTVDDWLTNKVAKHRVVSRRQLNLMLLGAMRLSYRQANAVNKIYEEYAHLIDFELNFDEFEMSCLTCESNVKASLQIMYLLEIVYRSNPIAFDENKLHTYPDMIADIPKFTIDLDLENSEEELKQYKDILKKLRVYVFKTPSTAISTSQIVERAFIEMLDGKAFELPIDMAKALSMYSLGQRLLSHPMRVMTVDSDTKLHPNYSKMKNSIKKLNHIKLTEQIASRREDNKNLSKNLKLSELIIVGTYTSCLLAFESYFSLENIDYDETYKIMFALNNIFAAKNVEVNILDNVKNRSKLLEEALLLSSYLYTDDEQVRRYTTVYATILGLLELLDMKADEQKREFTTTVHNEIERRSELENLKKSNTELLLETNRLKNKVEQLEAELNKNSKKTEVDIEMEYYRKLDKVLRENEKLRSQLEPESIDAPNLSETANNSIDLNDYSILFIGHPMAEKSALSLSSTIEFIDGTKPRRDLTKSYYKKFDVVLYQWEFLPHTSRDFLAQCKNTKARIINIEGTSTDRWKSKIESEINTNVSI